MFSKINSLWFTLQILSLKAEKAQMYTLKFYLLFSHCIPCRTWVFFCEGLNLLAVKPSSVLNFSHVNACAHTHTIIFEFVVVKSNIPNWYIWSFVIHKRFPSIYTPWLSNLTQLKKCKRSLVCWYIWSASTFSLRKKMNPLKRQLAISLSFSALNLRHIPVQIHKFSFLHMTQFMIFIHFNNYLPFTSLFLIP